MNKPFCFALIAVTTALSISCRIDVNKDIHVKSYVPGKNRFTINMNGDIREYLVHVPAGYKPTVASPVVFMLHGSGGNGEKFYHISGWKEVGEARNLLTVYPSSWRYDCVSDDGVLKRNVEKWNSYDLELCKGIPPKDDVKFLSQIIDELIKKFRVDRKRIYMVGFSNGGEMASRAALELSDKLAAVVACAGTLPVDTTFSPVRKLPVLLQTGNADSKLMTKLGTLYPLPMDIDKLFSGFPLVEQIVHAYVTSFTLNPRYLNGGNSNHFIFADYTGVAGKPDNVFRFMLVKDLNHNYPNGINHPMKGAEIHWDWMKDYRLSK